ncbi:MAG: phenylalanine--tRNA ligase subunit beta [Bacilli bacterium]|nr:phenylalanine--tRNA ligase subunit beta [Bacilli bacterium]
MKISLHWLNDYVDIKNENPRDMAEKITRAGVNVEGIKMFDIDKLVVGYVEEKNSHFNSDHLSVCKVNLGNETVQIVCGAPNVDKGQKVIVAKEGAILPGAFEIKPVTIRGVESNGMICALYELGLEEKEVNEHKGIHVLPDDAEVGTNPITYLGLDDIVYELDLNPNRNDCLSHLGFAYETAAVLGKNVALPITDTNPIQDNIKDILNLRVDTDNCLMYKARVVKDVIIGESPDFIKKRLMSAGMRPINNVIDISNYVMLEYGQPLHFFDKDKVDGNIVVRMAKDNEVVETIDHNKKTLTKDDVVITNDSDVIAIAGVMGCSNSEIDSNTKNILIESAIFNPYNVRYTSLRLDLRSEASLRFEKELNYEYTLEALNRACYLLEKYASGKVLNGIIVHDIVSKDPKIAVVSRDRINAVLGMELSHDNIIDAFKRLGFKFEEKDDIYTVIIPNRRMDVHIREDLIEEVGRLYGYDNIISKQPICSIKRGSYNAQTLFRKQISKRMRALGLDQVITYSLISDEENNLFNYNFKDNIKLQLPISADKNILRRSIIPSLLKVIDYNWSRQVKNINIYEISNVYSKDKDEYIEETKLAMAMLGNYINNNWQHNNIEVDFYVIKGIIENVLTYLGFEDRYDIRFKNNLPNELHPGISAEIFIDNESVGYFGKVHPHISKLPIFVGEINISQLFNKRVGKIKYNECSKYPSILKDIAFIFDKKIEVADIIKVIKKSGGKILENVDVFDVYIGNNIEDDKKSIALSLTFTDINKTLTDDEVNSVLNNIINEVSTKLNGLLRDK